jgi:hypothetical protein
MDTRERSSARAPAENDGQDKPYWKATIHEKVATAKTRTQKTVGNTRMRGKSVHSKDISSQESSL